MGKRFHHLKIKKSKPDWKKIHQMEGLTGLKKVAFVLNSHSMLSHMVLAMFLCLMVETISRFSLASALSFAAVHMGAFLYNSFIIFASLSIVFLLKRRFLARVIISSFWIFLGTVNGCVLAKRVTPFCFTDIQCLSDLFAMKNSNYFTVKEATLVVLAVGLLVAFCIYLFVKGPKYQGHTNKLASVGVVLGMLVLLPVVTDAAQESQMVASYFGNIAQGYRDNGFIYGFSSSVVGIGMDKPEGYSEEAVKSYAKQATPFGNLSSGKEEKEAAGAVSETGSKMKKDEASVSTEKIKNKKNKKASKDDKTEKAVKKKDPNLVVVLLESFIDPYEVKFLNFSEDPVPNFHKLYDNYSSGHLTVPVVGAGTSNTEFEVLTDMSMRYFGTGEYPHKTILKKTNCESIASAFSELGYGTHVVHNNGGNFYSRANAFSQMGFDTFTSKECMNIQEYTPMENWATDHILVNETKKAMDATPDQSDLVYTITVEAHGDYPEEKIVTNQAIRVWGAEDEGSNNAWEYYINQIHKVDKFIGDLTAMLDERGEDTMVVFFGDHLPTMDLEDDDMKTGSLFQTKYITWNNYGLPKKDADLAAYQLLAEITDQMDIHAGTMFTYTQEKKHLSSYMDGLEMLQYDILYGERYIYDGVDKYPATDIVMGIDEVKINSIEPQVFGGKMLVKGENFTPWTYIFVNGKKVSTKMISPHLLTFDLDEVSDGDTIVANICGSSQTIFRSSNELVYSEKNALVSGASLGMEVEKR